MDKESLKTWRIIGLMAFCAVTALGVAIGIDQFTTSSSSVPKSSQVKVSAYETKSSGKDMGVFMPLLTCKYQLPLILTDFKLLQMNELVLGDTTRSLETETGAGKVVLLQRKLTESDAKIAELRDTSEKKIRELTEAIRAGRAYLSKNHVAPADAAEFEAWANHCESAVPILRQWKRDLTMAASNDYLENTRARNRGDYANASNRIEYDAVMNRDFSELLAGPVGYQTAEK